MDREVTSVSKIRMEAPLLKDDNTSFACFSNTICIAACPHNLPWVIQNRAQQIWILAPLIILLSGNNAEENCCENVDGFRRVTDMVSCNGMRDSIPDIVSSFLGIWPQPMSRSWFIEIRNLLMAASCMCSKRKMSLRSNRHAPISLQQYLYLPLCILKKKTILYHYI